MHEIDHIECPGRQGLHWRRGGLAAAALALLAPAAGLAQSWPARPVHVITSDAGGGNDYAARLMAPVLGRELGQPVVIENQGAARVAQLVARAPADGYSIAFAGTTLWLTPFLRDSAGYDPVADFAPISMAIRQPTVLVAHPSVPANSVKDLIALARAKPGSINYSSGPIGGPQHLTGELFKSMAGIDIVLIPYKGAGPAITAVMAGQVQLMFPSPGAVAAHIKAGKLKALGVTSEKPSELLPGLAPVAEAVPGYESLSYVGFFAPAATQAAVVRRLNQDIVRTLTRPEIREALLKSGVETVASSPEQLAAIVKAEMTKWGSLIKAAGIREGSGT